MNTVTEDWFPKHRITVDDYYRMAEVGLLAHDARVELIQGEIIDMVPIGSRHAAVVNMLTEQLSLAAVGRAMVTVQRPIRLDQRSEPQPDLALVQRRADFYSAGHPRAADVLLVIEVSDSTLRYDREIKLPLYASHGIPEVWLIDINSKTLLRAQQPTSQGYATTTTLRGGSIEPAMLAGIVVELAQVLNI